MPTPVWRKKEVNHGPIVIAVVIAGAAMGFLAALLDLVLSQ